MLTAYYAVLGRRPQLTRDALDTSVRSRFFDAVIITRMQGQEKPELAPGRPTGRNFDLFLYDYAELNVPFDLDLGSAMTFITEMYDTSDKRKIWSIDTLVYDSSSAEAAITAHVDMIADEISRRRLIRR